jgi:hypothetical protein
MHTNVSAEITEAVEVVDRVEDGRLEPPPAESDPVVEAIPIDWQYAAIPADI